MPHLIYNLQTEFFEGGDWNIGEDLTATLARCFSFDPGLLARLFAARVAAAPMPAPVAASAPAS